MLRFALEVSDYRNLNELVISSADGRSAMQRFVAHHNATQIALGLRELADKVEQTFPELRARDAE